MTSFVARLAVGAVLLWGLLMPAARGEAPPPVTLGATPAFSLTAPMAMWLETGTELGIEQVRTQADRFETLAALQRMPLQAGSSLWIRLRLARSEATPPADWTLNIPLPFVDEVQLHYQDREGRWLRQIAGDNVPQALWSRRGLYPDFTLPAGGPGEQDIYLRVRNFKDMSIPIRLARADVRESQRITEWLALGLLLGVLATMVGLALLRFVEHRGNTDLGSAVFSAVTLLTTAQINGVTNATVLAEFPTVADYAYGVVPMLAVGSSLLFVRTLYAISTHYARYDNFLRAVGLGTLFSAISYAIDHATADRVGAAVMLVATTTGLVATFLSWRGNSRIWVWLLAAYVPQYLCVLRLLLEALALVPTWWEMRYALSGCVALSVPILVYSLARATHDRKELEVRARHLPTQDALTGLLTPTAFNAELEKAYQRVVAERESMALVLVRVVNYETIRKGLGDPVAENCLLRAVVKLHRILRDVDPAGRSASDTFALILEGERNRQDLTERMVQLIGSGLTPLAGLHPPITLQFHVVCLLLHEHPLPASEALPALEQLLSSMSNHTRRPIRFLEAPHTQPVPMSGTSSLP